MVNWHPSTEPCKAPFGRSRYTVIYIQTDICWGFPCQTNSRPYEGLLEGQFSRHPGPPAEKVFGPQKIYLKHRTSGGVIPGCHRDCWLKVVTITIHAKGSRFPHQNQWLFLVPVKGGRWRIIPQVAGKIPLIYHIYIYIYIYCLLGGEKCYRSHLLREPFQQPLTKRSQNLVFGAWDLIKLAKL